MLAFIIGLIFLAASIYVLIPSLPFSPAWGEYVIVVIKGSLPLLGILIGFIAVFVGLAEMKDRKARKKE